MTKRKSNRGLVGNRGANKGKSYNVGNTFNLRWTKVTVNEKLDEMIDLILKRNEEKKSIYSISSLLGEVFLYNRWPDYMRDRYKEDDEIMNKLDFIYTVVEGNLFKKGIDNPRINGALVQFGLRAFHQRNDEQNINLKNDHSGEININMIPSEGLKDE